MSACPRCGSRQWIGYGMWPNSGPLKRQCVPCGRVYNHPRDYNHPKVGVQRSQNHVRIPAQDLDLMASWAVRARIRRRWARRRAATDPTGQVLTVVGIAKRDPLRRFRVVANPEAVERCLSSQPTAERLFAQIEKVNR